MTTDENQIWQANHVTDENQLKTDHILDGMTISNFFHIIAFTCTRGQT